MSTIPTDFDDVLTNIGFNAACRTVLVDAARENLDLGVLSTWEDTDCDSLVQSLRKTPQGTTITTPCYVAIRAVENLKTVAYVCRHLARTGRTLQTALFTKDFINDWKFVRKAEAEYEEPQETPRLSKADNSTIYEFIEDFPEQLARFTGIGGRPLAYVIRERPQVPAEADDQLYGRPGSNYGNIRDEIVQRAAHAGTPWNEDNKRVFELLRDSISDFEEVKVWIKGFVRAKDGRGAWEAFKAHYLGSSQLDGIAERADQRIESLIYSGEKSRYTFETHVSNFMKAHLDLKKVGNEPDGRTKVRKFLQSIRAAELQTAIGVVKSQDSYLTDFEATINYLRRFVMPITPGSRTVSAVVTGGNDSGAPPKPPGLTFRWYKKEEFNSLPEEHKAWLRWEKRRRDQESKGEKKDRRKIKAAIRKEKRKLAKVKLANKKAKQDQTEADADEPNP
jgi:hypothetical protein